MAGDRGGGSPPAPRDETSVSKTPPPFCTATAAHQLLDEDTTAAQNGQQRLYRPKKGWSVDGSEPATERGERYRGSRVTWPTHGPVAARAHQTGSSRFRPTSPRGHLLAPFHWVGIFLDTYCSCFWAGIRITLF